MSFKRSSGSESTPRSCSVSTAYAHSTGAVLSATPPGENRDHKFLTPITLATSVLSDLANASARLCATRSHNAHASSSTAALVAGVDLWPGAWASGR